jgi:GNAT superfamily N-acetyltransferase
MPLRIREIASGEREVIALIAERMHLTLTEVLDEQRARSMFTPAQLVDRVTWHLDRGNDRQAAVFVAEHEAEVVGHTMVRVEHAGDDTYGLFATTYVQPESRGCGAASALLLAGERWMHERAMMRAVTFTEAHNTKLLALYRKHGYEVEILDAEWARASKALAGEAN